MLVRIGNSRMLRYAGLFTWAAVGLWLIIFLIDPQSLPLDELDGAWVLLILRWLVVYLLFGGVYWWITRSLGDRKPGIWDHLGLLLLTCCAIGVSYLSGTALGSILLMVVAGLLPWMLPLRIAVAWLVVGNMAVLPIYTGPLGFPLVVGVLQALGYMGFSSFVFTTALVARQQAQARDEQRRLNSELRATRALLAESVRVNERTRIARELHDLLGHHLTALSLNLEVANHLTSGAAQEHVGQAHTLAKLLLSDVREAVSQIRDDGAIEMGATLRPLAENVPGLAVEMRMPEPFLIEDAEKSHVLLRCTQEIITNTVRHAQAQRLALDYDQSGGWIRLRAKDDGRGANLEGFGNGLRGMRERLAAYGGSMTVRTAPGEGFALDLALPVAELPTEDPVDPWGGLADDAATAPEH
ncbi:MAG TPA: sensor histidine kinase [Candidatus Luteimonas excrementigallinarum]|nr:sensor histidine kinase [Candidatus Luteimonas excrementigallinarum]